MKCHNKWLKWWFPILTLIFLLVGAKTHLPGEHLSYASLNGETLTYSLAIRDAHRKKHYHAGYHYQILKEFAHDQECFMEFMPVLPDSTSIWDALMSKEIRIAVIDPNRDTMPPFLEEYLILGPSLNSKGHVWVFSKDDFEAIQVMRLWFSSFKHTSVYANIALKFYMNSAYSPYDEIIKKQSKTIGWDWRLMAALIHQESTFRMNATSPKGAAGLMQVMRGTAEKYGVSYNELYDPQENIKAGTLFLQELSRQFSDSLVSKSEQIKFILAAYNAGPEQLKNCRDFAALQGKDPDVWNDVAQVIPLMRTNEFAHLFPRTFRGDETINFVEEVLAQYEWYCAFLE